MEASRCCWVTSRVWSHHYSLSLPTRQHQQLNNRDPDPSNTCHTELQSRTPPRVLLEVTDAPIYRAGPQLEAPLYVPDAPNNREGPQAREPSNCLSRLRYRKRLGKEVFWSPATRGSKKKKKDSDSTITPGVEAVCSLCPCLLAPPGSLQAKQLCHLHMGAELPQAKKKKSCVYACRVTLVVSNSLRSCRLWPVRQEYWSILANTGRHTLLEHYLSCCLSCQLPWVPGAARTPATQAAAPPPPLAFMG